MDTLKVNYSWPSNNLGVKAADLFYAVKNPHEIFDSPKLNYQ